MRDQVLRQGDRGDDAKDEEQERHFRMIGQNDLPLFWKINQVFERALYF